VTDWATSAAASFAGIGLVFAGFQVRLTRRQAVFEHLVSLNGVAVSWQAIEAPDHPDDDGTAEWHGTKEPLCHSAIPSRPRNPTIDASCTFNPECMFDEHDGFPEYLH
jgi:hypothetical protein